MQATTAELDLLEQLQTVDVSLIKARRQLEDLPQAQLIATLQEKRAGVEAKLEQVDKMAESASKEISRINEEEALLRGKLMSTQAKIDEAESDYRAIESLTRDLEGITKRLETLVGDYEIAEDRSNQISSLRSQILKALESLKSQEDTQQRSYNADAGKLKRAIAGYEKEHESIAQQLSQSLVDAYMKARRTAGGVALAHLEDQTCSACRSIISDAKLQQVHQQAPLATCPVCSRLLVIDA